MEGWWVARGCPGCERSSLPVFDCLCERGCRQTLANCVVSLPAPVSRGLCFPLEKTKGCMWGMSTLLSLLLLQWAQFPPFWNAKYGASFNFWGSLACYLRANQSSSRMRRAAGILIVQELPAALVDIKPNRPLDGRQQMLREWKDYCLKAQWHPSPSLSLLLSHSLMATACTQTQHSIAETHRAVC